jgi:integrase
MNMKQIKPDLWLVDVRVYKGSKQYRKRQKVHGGIKAAEARFHEIRKELKERAKKEPRSLTFSAAITATFAEALDFYLARNDIGDSKHYFDRLRADLGNVPIDALAESFDRWLLLIRQGKSKITGRALTPATINRFIAWSKAALNFCLSYGMIKNNPIAHIKKTKEIPRDIALNDLDKKNLFNTLEREAPFLVPLVQFALLVPCRTGELIQMRRDDLDLFNNAIRVRCGVMKNKEMAAWKPIPPSMREYFTSLPSSTEYLFPRKIGERLVQIKTFPYELFRHCLKLARLEGWRLHDARHAAVSALLNNNTPEQVVCQIAGWTSSAMLRTYYHRDGLQALKMVRFGDEKQEKPYSVRSLEKAVV